MSGKGLVGVGLPRAAAGVKVGDLVFLPNRLHPGHPGYASAEEMFAVPGQVASVVDGWAMVHLAGWGVFGRPVEELEPVVVLATLALPLPADLAAEILRGLREAAGRCGYRRVAVLTDGSNRVVAARPVGRPSS